MRKQRAIYWEVDEIDRYGRPTFKAPVEVDCRWDDGSDEFRDAQGQSFRFSSTVYPDRVMQVGDMLKRGEMESDTPADPTTDSDAHPIQRFYQNPNFRATETLYTAYL